MGTSDDEGGPCIAVKRDRDWVIGERGGGCVGGLSDVQSGNVFALDIAKVGAGQCDAMPERLDRMLTLAGITPSQLAEDAGVGQATISRARAGRPLTPVSWLRIETTLAGYPKHAAVEALLSKRNEQAA